MPIRVSTRLQALLQGVRQRARARKPAGLTAHAWSELIQMASTLQDLTTRTDPDFVALAGDLKALYGCAAQLGRTVSGQINSMREALEHIKLGGEEALPAQVMATFEANLQQAANDRDFLGGTAASLERLRRQGGQIDRLARLLSISISSIAVESSRSPTCQQAFGSFVEELRQLSGRINELAWAIVEQAGTTHGQLAPKISKISTDLEQLKMLAGNSKTTLVKTSGEISKLLASSWTVMQEVENGVRGIGAQADQAVYFLQFGDIIRQRLEHVVSALQEIPATTAAPEPETLAKTDQILAIQCAQLEAIVEEIESSGRRLHQAFNGLAEQGEELAKNLGRIGSPDWDGASGRNPFEALKAGFENVSLWQNQSLDQIGRARAMSQTAGRDAQQLSVHLGRLKTLNGEMHLQALNAVVKAALLEGEGVTLAVLSTHVHKVFEESSRLVGETVEVLESMTVLPDAASQGTAAQVGNQSQNAIRAVCDFPARFREINTAAAALVRQQKENLIQATRRLEFLARLTGEIRTVITRSHAFRRQLAPLKGTEKVPENLVAPDERYTMESERLVHARISQQGKIDPAGAPPETAGVTEFWDSATPPVAAEGGDPQTRDDGQANPAAVLTVSPSAPGPLAGVENDNIEFF